MGDALVIVLNKIYLCPIIIAGVMMWLHLEHHPLGLSKLSDTQERPSSGWEMITWKCSHWLYKGKYVEGNPSCNVMVCSQSHGQSITCDYTS
jgi:hypothetical protein